MEDVVQSLLKLLCVVSVIRMFKPSHLMGFHLFMLVVNHSVLFVSTFEFAFDHWYVWVIGVSLPDFGVPMVKVFGLQRLASEVRIVVDETHT